jgi:hypothetical protein
MAKAVKAFLTADRTAYPPDDRLLMARELLGRFELSESDLSGEQLIQRADSWWQLLGRLFRAGNDHRKYPISHHHGGRNFTTIADLVLETPAGLILVQHSGFTGNGRARDTKAIELAPWLYLTKTALQITFNQPTVRTFVHFVLTGTLVELEVQSDGS